MTLADVFAVGGTIKHDGATYTMRPPTLIEQGQFQRWLEQRVHDAIDRGPEKPAEKDKRHDRAYTEAGLGRYEWGGPYAVEALWTPAGLAKIFALVCGLDDATAEAVVAHKFKEIAVELIGRAEKDPKLMAQVCASLGLPSDWWSNNSSTRPSAAPSTSSDTSPTISSPSSTPSSAAPTG